MKCRSCRGPAVIEIPTDVMSEDVPDGWSYEPTKRFKSAPDSRAVEEVAGVLVNAQRPVIYAGGESPTAKDLIAKKCDAYLMHGDPPERIAEIEESHTGRYLRRML